jgi:DNA-binding NtrC family response regulator
MEPAEIKILVIDDDAALLAVLETGLRFLPGNRVTAEISAVEACRQIQQNEFDLVITDYSLNHSGINGLNLLRAARERNPATLVIMITAYASIEIILESIHLGAYDFLTKPFRLDELQLVVRNAIQQILLARENNRLRRQVAETIASLNRIERQHGELLNRIRQLGEEGNGAELESAFTLASLNHAGAQELRRRRLREQMSAYLRMGESIGEQLARERQKIESIFREVEI